MGRTSDAKERLVETACELMHDKGYEAVGVGAICAKAGVNKGSFYYFFESKQLLGIAALDAMWDQYRPVWAGALEGPGQPLDRIEKMLQTMTRNTREGKKACGHVRGCIFGNFALEQSTLDAEVQGRVQQIFDDQLRMIEAVLKEAEQAGQLADGVTAKSGARSIVALIEGTVMMAKLRNDPNLLRGMGGQVRRLVAA